MLSCLRAWIGGFHPDFVIFDFHGHEQSQYVSEEREKREPGIRIDIKNSKIGVTHSSPSTLEFFFQFFILVKLWTY
jgi:hypothetical protein